VEGGGVSEPSEQGILDRIDQAVDELCACGCRTPITDASPSAWYATADCQSRYLGSRFATDPHDVYRRPDAALVPLVDSRPVPLTEPGPRRPVDRISGAFHRVAMRATQAADAAERLREFAARLAETLMTHEGDDAVRAGRPDPRTPRPFLMPAVNAELSRSAAVDQVTGLPLSAGPDRSILDAIAGLHGLDIGYSMDPANLQVDAEPGQGRLRVRVSPELADAVRGVAPGVMDQAVRAAMLAEQDAVRQRVVDGTHDLRTWFV
jgi:hypothetical protein